jgi:hypothetical protein
MALETGTLGCQWLRTRSERFLDTNQIEPIIMIWGEEKGSVCMFTRLCANLEMNRSAN